MLSKQSRQLSVMSKSSHFRKFDWEKSRGYLWILWKRLRCTWPTWLEMQTDRLIINSVTVDNPITADNCPSTYHLQTSQRTETMSHSLANTSNVIPPTKYFHSKKVGFLFLQN